MMNKCKKCGSDLLNKPLPIDKKAYEKVCEFCGAELCPKCGHRRSAHEPQLNCPLQDECQITWDGAFTCDCTYYKSDIDKEMKWNIFSLHEKI